ncbi:MAG: hydantoinase B/oxoprolinase family protein [Cyanobacteriota bacterium]|nr:hydantoinase B/oxoprolinase family protein [Cyanobacteriota bacterium]
MPGGWRFWIDRGGTFTDVIGLAPGGPLQVRKVLSVQPDQPGDPAVLAIRELLGLAPEAPIPAGLVSEVRLGTTVATNALLEHRGAPVLLLINEGFADLLAIGDQHRPDIFALRIERPTPLEVRVLEMPGRLAADGSELEPLQLGEPLAQQLRRALANGYESVAVALLHAYRNPAHELALEQWLLDQGLSDVALSHRLSPQPRLVPRGHTALVEAAVAPILRAYLDQAKSALGEATPLRVMRSSGALAVPAQLHAKDTILSGPAGGMVGAVAAAMAAQPGLPIVGFDMGGTSTDVFHFDPARGEAAWERSPETEIAGLRLQAPMLPVHTVAAGGGSIIRCEGGRLLVGPESAGADPGPAAYRRGGPATITDANLLLGRLPLAALPPLFGPAGDQPADLEAMQARFAELAKAAGLPPERVAEGALQVAIERMAAAIRRISIQRGHDIRGALLVSYGGAGGQHACRLAQQLGIRRVLLHPLSGVLSAYGIGMAPQSQLREQAVRQPLRPELVAELRQQIEALASDAAAALETSGDLTDGAAPQQLVRVELRYPGSERGLELIWPSDAGSDQAVVAALEQAFVQAHRQRFGYLPADQQLTLERLLLELTAPSAAPVLPEGHSSTAQELEPSPATTPVWLGENTGWQMLPLWRREQLPAGLQLEGPAVVLDATTTLMLEPGWRALVQPSGALLLEHQLPAELPAAAPQSTTALVDPVRLELFNHRFAAIAEQMGVQLQQSSRSVNIRERLDFSCALFDGQGQLVANAPHIPVHLGSMGESVTALLADVVAGRRPALQPGDVILSNDPYAGGTHLPDITAITPVFAGDSSVPQFFVASRGHHADVGGITPGSMPAFSRTIADEGLLLRNEPFLRNGAMDEPLWRERFNAGPHPVRNPQQLLADLQAQAAANRQGAEALQQLIQAEGLEVVQAYMGHVQANAAEAVRRVVDRLCDGSHALQLDNGAWIRVAVQVDRSARRVRVDFTGSAPQLESNLNAPLAVTKAVVLYVFRCLVGEAIPLNAGCFEPIELVVPRGSLLNPNPPAAVVAGNVETSQAATNALFAALGVQAAAQGTMNNLSFGDAGSGAGSRQYYETICGGTGAGVLPNGEAFAGAAAVQSHMTNSRLTDPEILEERFPVRLERFAQRRGSGGHGRWLGGDGVVRQLRALEPITVSLLSSSRQVPPFGLAGGEPGACGQNWLLRGDGREELLAGCCALELKPGEGLRIETPGGGGYGSVEARP